MKTNVLKLIALTLAAILLLSACGAPTPPADPNENGGNEVVTPNEGETRVITDMAGREVEIPANPQRVYSTSPIGTYFPYAINPDKMIGWSSELRTTERHFIDEKYAELPVLGGTFGNNSKMNPEVIINANPDLIISQGPDKITEMNIDNANKMQEQLGIPVIVVGSSARTIDKAFDFLGDALNEKEQCGKLSAFAKDVLETVSASAAKIPEDKKVRIYYAEGEEGLNTDPQKSPHAIIFDMVGCVNVAELEEAGGTGNISVSPEQILSWDPDMIIMNPRTQGPLFDAPDVDSLYNKLKSDDKGFWGYLDAVKEGNFYEVPIGPFNWADRPPSVNQVLGVLWCGKLVYPDYYTYDLREKAKEFFELFYHYTLSDEEFDKMLSHSLK